MRSIQRCALYSDALYHDIEHSMLVALVGHDILMGRQLSSSNEVLDDLYEAEGLLLRAADLIGQLGDPNDMRKANALFYEFDEIGLNKTLGYTTSADVIYKYPRFYWNDVAPEMSTAIRYLNVTSSRRQWVANLHRATCSAPSAS